MWSGWVLFINSIDFNIIHIGWDIVEPITYTISQLTLVFGIRFFLKYGRKRDFAIMQEVFMNKIINKNRVLRDRYKDINEHLLDKRIQKKKNRLADRTFEESQNLQPVFETIKHFFINFEKNFI